MKLGGEFLLDDTYMPFTYSQKPAFIYVNIQPEI
jgi:hypothetical protein